MFIDANKILLVIRHLLQIRLVTTIFKGRCCEIFKGNYFAENLRATSSVHVKGYLNSVSKNKEEWIRRLKQKHKDKILWKP